MLTEVRIILGAYSKKSQGVSISEYLAQKRFDQVCKMLIETNLTARDIGRAVGLNSGSYFYTSFKSIPAARPTVTERRIKLKFLIISNIFV